MLALLGYSPEDDTSTLLDIKQWKGGKFYLIIDGFDEFAAVFRAAERGQAEQQQSG